MTNKLITINSNEYVYYRKKTEAEWDEFVTMNQPLWIATGTKIKSLRKKLGISQKELARRAGICARTLRKLEAGKFIRRFKTVSKSCFNALGLDAYKDFLELQKIVLDFE